jgi:hypothetical protein
VLSSISRITAAASDSVSLSELLKALRKDFAPSDSLSLSESVTYQLTTPQPSNYIIPDSYTVYNHNWQTISANLSVWWDNNISTSYSIFYTPPAPANPRSVFLYFNNPVSLPRDINIYISGFTTSKTLYIYVYFFGELVSTTSLVPSGVGWSTITLIEGTMDYFDEMEIKTDSSVLGYIGIAEFHINQ